jgi:hypothetical protein
VSPLADKYTSSLERSTTGIRGDVEVSRGLENTSVRSGRVYKEYCRLRVLEKEVTNREASVSHTTREGFNAWIFSCFLVICWDDDRGLKR